MSVDYMRDIIDRAEKNNPPAPGDYTGEDGFLHCGVCHAVKETDIDGIRVPCACDCKKKEREQEAERKRQAVNDERRKRCFTTSNLAQCRIEQMDATKAAEIARLYIENWPSMKAEGCGLLLWGDVGTGKTFIAAAIANAIIDLGESARMRSAGEIILEVQGSEDKTKIINELCDKSMLVLDDLGAERDTAFGAEIMYTVVNHRYQTGRPFIVTTNVPLSEINGATETGKSRLYSRILERCIPVKVDGPDRRKAEGAERLKKIRKLFGLEN